MKHFSKLLIILFSISLVISGCSASPEPTAPPVAKELTIGLKLAPSNLDIRTAASVPTTQVLLDNVYETLVTLDENQNVIPLLAKEWKISNDGKTYDFTLSDNLAFSNGDKITAKTIADSINDVIKNKLKGYDKLPQENLVIKDLDDTHLQITLGKPYANLLWSLTQAQGAAYDKSASFDANTTAIGSGPYLVDSYTPSSQIVFKKNPNYWGTPANLDKVTIKYFEDDNTALNALISGDIQVIAPLDNKLATTLAGNPGYPATIAKGTDKFQLSLNSKKIKDNEREAIVKAINNQEIITARGGVDKLLGGPITELDPGYLDFPQKFDLEKAKELTKGESLTYTLKYDNSTYGNELGDILKSQLAKAGITLKVEYLDFSTWLDEVYIKHNYELTLVDQANPRDVGNWTNPDYYYNFKGVKSALPLYNKALESTDNDVTNSYLGKLSKEIVDSNAAVWLFNFQTTVITKYNIQNFPFTNNQIRLPLAKITIG
jgi:peptide/nickel transport system substrate-binding protein